MFSPKHAHGLQREIKDDLNAEPVNTACTDIIGKSRSHIINSVYCSDLPEFNEMTKMTFFFPPLVGGDKTAADHFQQLLNKIARREFEVALFITALNDPQYLFSCHECDQAHAHHCDL